MSPAREDLAFPVIAAPDYGPAALFFTLTGNGGPTGADNGGFFPSTAFGQLSAGASDLQGSKVSVVDLGQSPRTVSASTWASPVPPVRAGVTTALASTTRVSNKIFFSTNYIQFPNCAPPQFTLTLATCGGTRDALANWGTSVNSVTP